MLTTLPTLIETHIKTGKVKVIFHNTLSYGEGSIRAAEAGACAARQGRFWSMHSALYHRQNDLFGSWSFTEWLDVVAPIGKTAGVDVNALLACINNHSTQAQLKANDAAQRVRGIYFQPIFDISINGGAPKRIFGAPSYEGFVAAFEGR